MSRRIVLGNRAEELRALQLLSFIHADIAMRLPRGEEQRCAERVAASLVFAASRSLSLASCGGIDTPLEVVALATRNVFEIWLRMKHVMSSDAACHRWRSENLSDQMQVYQAMLSLPGPDAAKEVIRTEMQRLEQFGRQRGMEPVPKPMMAGEVAKAVGEVEEYRAFYKLYSKLVHPSSWSVNSPSAVDTPMYRHTLIANAQLYGWRIVGLIEDLFQIPADAAYNRAVQQMNALTQGGAPSDMA